MLQAGSVVQRVQRRPGASASVDLSVGSAAAAVDASRLQAESTVDHAAAPRVAGVKRSRKSSKLEVLDVTAVTVEAPAAPAPLPVETSKKTIDIDVLLRGKEMQGRAAPAPPPPAAAPLAPQHAAAVPAPVAADPAVPPIDQTAAAPAAAAVPTLRPVRVMATNPPACYFPLMYLLQCLQTLAMELDDPIVNSKIVEFFEYFRDAEV
jgi:hypothetical protein